MGTRPVQVGEQVVLVGKHPWVGHSGEVIDKSMSGVVTVRIKGAKNDFEVTAAPRQYLRELR